MEVNELTIIIAKMDNHKAVEDPVAESLKQRGASVQVANIIYPYSGFQEGRLDLPWENEDPDVFMVFPLVMYNRLLHKEREYLSRILEHLEGRRARCLLVMVGLPKDWRVNYSGRTVYAGWKDFPKGDEGKFMKELDGILI
jgi:hypothetical protein